jgi:medium-chain acyl-[acyl-carrier-protein] hydrolase
VEPSWVLTPKPNPQATLRLVCFPYAGVGPSVYRPWLAALPPHIEARMVQLPGREGRWREPALTNLGEIADQVARAIVPHLQSPFAFYGHSLGALVSFEVTRRLRAAGGADAAAPVSRRASRTAAAESASADPASQRRRVRGGNAQAL